MPELQKEPKEISPQDLLEIIKTDSIAILGAFEEPKLAANWKRFLAKIVDFALCLVVVVVFLFVRTINLESQYTESKIAEINQICTSLEKFETAEICKDFIQKVEILTLESMIFGFAFLAFYLIIWSQSLGKKIFKIQILSENNQEISLLQRIAREILNLVMVLTLFLLLIDLKVEEIINFVAITMIFANGQILFTKRGFHDMIAKTKVVEKL